jgi:alpha-1,6-mannosyltransferase
MQVVFRCDMAPLVVLMVLQMVVSGRVHVATAMATGIFAGLASLLLTAGVDSLFWGRPLWPEGEVFFFNTVLNK